MQSCKQGLLQLYTKYSCSVKNNATILLIETKYKTLCPFLGHWHPSFRFLMTSSSGFQIQSGDFYWCCRCVQIYKFESLCVVCVQKGRTPVTLVQWFVDLHTEVCSTHEQESTTQSLFNFDQTIRTCYYKNGFK